MRIRRSLLVRALALILAVFMLLFACLFALLYRSARDTVRTQELQNVSTRLEMFRAYLDLALDNGRNTVYQFMQSGLMSSSEQDKIQAYFQHYSETNSVISVKFLLEGDRVLAIDQPLLLSSMTADSAFFYSQAQHNRLVISAPYYSPLAAGRVVALIRSIPGSGDRPERLLVMEIRTSNLIGTMSEKFSRQEAVVLLTAHGDTVYINFYAGVLGHLVSRNGQLELGDTLRQSLRGMGQGVKEIELDNRSILVQCSRYSSQWSIYYLIGAEEFYARINAAIRQYIMLFAAGTLLLLLGETLVILSLLRPVNQLARQVDALPVDKPARCCLCAEATKSAAWPPASTACLPGCAWRIPKRPRPSVTIFRWSIRRCKAKFSRTFYSIRCCAFPPACSRAKPMRRSGCSAIWMRCCAPARISTARPGRCGTKWRCFRAMLAFSKRATATALM